MTVSVGLGSGNKQQMLANIGHVLQVQERALALGIATPQNIYEACVEFTKNAGFKDSNKFWTIPSQQPPQEQPNPLAEAEKVKADAMMQTEQFKAQMKQAEDQAKAQLEMQKLQLEKWKTEVQEETKRLIANMNNSTTIKKAEMDIIGRSDGVEMVDDDLTQPISPAVSELVNGMVGAVSQIAQAQLIANQQLVESQRESSEALINQLNKPKQVIRGADGRVTGVK
jgi:hypothetical protein